MDVDGDFGVQLRRRRMAAGVSLAELARRTHYNKGYLSKVETGARPPTAAVARICDGALDAGGSLIELVALRNGVGSGAGRASRPPDVADQGDVWVLGMGAEGSVWFQPVPRREVLAAGAASVLAWRAGGGQPPPGAEPDAVLTTWSEVFDQIRALGQQASPQVVLPAVIAATRTLQQLAVSAGGRRGMDYYLLASRYAEFAGWMAQEAGHDPAALWWTEQAVALAAAGGDRELAAYALVRKALVALYAGDAPATIRLAKQAQRDESAGDRVRGLAAQREAQGHALAGNYPDCQRALDRARGWCDGTRTGPRPVLGSSTVSSPVALSQAWCLHDLGRPAQAAELLDRELDTVERSAHRFHARWGARRALAYATAGEIDHACALGESLLADLAITDSATVRCDVRALARTLNRWSSHPPVRRIHPQLTAALRRPSNV